jgi:hypothetical protein
MIFPDLPESRQAIVFINLFQLNEMLFGGLRLPEPESVIVHF